MADTIVPHARFLEVRQRRQQVAAELAKQQAEPSNGESGALQPVTIDCEPLTDGECGTVGSEPGVRLRPTSVPPVR